MHQGMKRCFVVSGGTSGRCPPTVNRPRRKPPALRGDETQLHLRKISQPHIHQKEKRHRERPETTPVCGGNRHSNGHRLRGDTAAPARARARLVRCGRARRHRMASPSPSASRTCVRRSRDGQVHCCRIGQDPRCRSPDRHCQDWHQGRIAWRQARPSGCVARRHGRPACRGAQRPAVPFNGQGPVAWPGSFGVACLRPRHTRSHVAGRGSSPFGHARGSARHGGLPVPTGRRDRPRRRKPQRRAGNGQGRRSGQSQGRCRIGPAHRRTSAQGLHLLSTWCHAGQHRRVQHQAQRRWWARRRAMGGQLSHAGGGGNCPGLAEHRQPPHQPDDRWRRHRGDGGHAAVATASTSCPRPQNSRARYARCRRRTRRSPTSRFA